MGGDVQTPGLSRGQNIGGNSFLPNSEVHDDHSYPKKKGAVKMEDGVPCSDCYL